MHVCALIPAWNEQDRIGATVRAVRSRRAVDEVIVIDDGSTDSTAQAARDAGATDVIVLKPNGGKGAALSAGFASVRARADVVLLLDADLGSSGAECTKLLRPILEDKADMTVGLLPPDKDLDAEGSSGGGMGLVVRLARWGLERSTGQKWQQPLSGQRAIRTKLLESVGGTFPSGFGVEVGLTLDAVRAGFRVQEVPTAFRHRVTEGDWSSFLHRGRQFIDVVKVLRAR